MKSIKIIKKTHDRLVQKIKSYKTFGLPISYVADLENKSKRVKRQLLSKMSDLIDEYETDMPHCPETVPVEEYRIWVMWYQGEGNMPELLRKCYDSICRNAKWEVILITKENINEYLDIPDYILNKVENGLVSLTVYSDYIRIALLRKYGGMWMDISIYVTKTMYGLDDYNLYSIKRRFDDNELGHWRWSVYLMGTNIKNNHLFFYLQWYYEQHFQKYEISFDYFQTDYMIAVCASKHEEVEVMLEKIPYNNTGGWTLLNKLNDEYVQEAWDTIVRENYFQKLSYKKDYHTRTKTGKLTFAGYILKSI